MERLPVNYYAYLPEVKPYTSGWCSFLPTMATHPAPFIVHKSLNPCPTYSHSRTSIIISQKFRLQFPAMTPGYSIISQICMSQVADLRNYFAVIYGLITMQPICNCNRSKETTPV